MRYAAFGCGHVFGNPAAQADDFDGLVGAFGASSAEAPRSVIGQERVKIGVANAAILSGLNLGKVNGQIAGALAHGWGGEDFCVGGRRGFDRFSLSEFGSWNGGLLYRLWHRRRLWNILLHNVRSG